MFGIVNALILRELKQSSRPCRRTFKSQNLVRALLLRAKSVSFHVDQFLRKCLPPSGELELLHV